MADEEMVVTITHSGYIKRTHVEAYRSQRRGGKGVTGMETKEEDFVERSVHRLDALLSAVLHQPGQDYWLKVHEIPEGGRAAKGKAVVNLLSLARGRAVAAFISVSDFNAGGYVFFATRQGDREEDGARASRTRARRASWPSAWKTTTR